MVGVIDALQKKVQQIPADAKVIPGHGAQVSLSDVCHSLQVLEGMQNAIQRHIGAGKPLNEILKMDVVSPWKDSYVEPCDYSQGSCDHQDERSFVRGFYDALTARAPSDAGQGSRPVRSVRLYSANCGPYQFQIDAHLAAARGPGCGLTDH